MKKLIVAAVVVLILGFIGYKATHKPKPTVIEAGAIPVNVATVRTGTMSTIIPVSGNIQALEKVQISAKASGRVISVPYREDNPVAAGAVVVQQDTSDLILGVQRAQAGVNSARAALSRATTSAKVSSIELDSRVTQAQAALASAKSRLQAVKSYFRPQEVAIKQRALDSAKAELENDRLDLDRTRALYADGALSKQSLDAAQKSYNVSLANYEAAQQALSMYKEGARQEDIDQAEKSVASAEVDLQVAQSNRARKLNDQEEIKSARAGLASAEAALADARQQLSDASVRTPISGRVSKRLTEPGQMASPGATLMEIVNLNTVYYEATVSEVDIHRIRLGMPVSVQVDALPGRAFTGRVTKILPTADISSRQFTVWIHVPNTGGALRPGMFARGNVQVERHDNAVLVAKDAVVSGQESDSAYVVNGGKVKSVLIRTGSSTREEVEVLSGLRPGDKVVTSGKDKLSDGIKVTIAK